MRRSFGVLILAAALAGGLGSADAALAGRVEGLAPVRPAAERGNPDRYIVVLKPGGDPRAVAAAAGARPRHVYGAALAGFAASLDRGQLAALQRHGQVAYIEQDAEVQAAATQSPVTWGLDRIDQRTLPLSNSYTFNNTGAGVTAYIIDTGIDPAHSEFGGRAGVGYDAIGGDGLDCHGHGTFNAGIVGGARYGVAKRVSLVGVRVLNCEGLGTVADVIEGVDWVTANSPGPAVALLAAGADFNRSLNAAVENSIFSGVPYAVVAGNNGADACSFSPSSVDPAMTISASDSADRAASFANTGACVDWYAPGVDIRSAFPGDITVILSGTSAAAAYTAGVAARYRQRHPDASSARVHTALGDRATRNVITGVPSGTDSLLLFSRLAGRQPPALQQARRAALRRPPAR